LPRFNLLSLEDEQHELDVGFTKVDGYETMKACVQDLAQRKFLEDLKVFESPLKRKHHVYKKNASPSLLENLPSDDNATLSRKAHLRNDVDRVLESRILEHVPQANFSHFKYLIHMAGSATGSYSRNLQYLWAHGSVVLIWDQVAVEHYYQYLVPGLHYLPVNESNVFDALRHLNGDPALQRRLRQGARSFASTYISGDALTKRWAHVFEILDKRQSSISQDRSPPPQTACTCDADLLKNKVYAECGKCIITRLKGSKLNKFLGITPKTPPPPPPQ